MAKLFCEACKAETPVPVVHCGPGILGEDPSKLYCPGSGHTENIEIPKHCEKPMKYVEESCCK